MRDNFENFLLAKAPEKKDGPQPSQSQQNVQSKFSLNQTNARWTENNRPDLLGMQRDHQLVDQPPVFLMDICAPDVEYDKQPPVNTVLTQSQPENLLQVFSSKPNVNDRLTAADSDSQVNTSFKASQSGIDPAELAEEKERLHDQQVEQMSHQHKQRVLQNKVREQALALLDNMRKQHMHSERASLSEEQKAYQMQIDQFYREQRTIQVVTQYRYAPHMIYSRQNNLNEFYASKLPENIRQIATQKQIKAGYLPDFVKDSWYLIDGNDLTIWRHEDLDLASLNQSQVASVQVTCDEQITNIHVAELDVDNEKDQQVVLIFVFTMIQVEIYELNKETFTMVKSKQIDQIGLSKDGEIHSSISCNYSLTDSKQIKGGLKLKNRIYIGAQNVQELQFQSHFISNKTKKMTFKQSSNLPTNFQPCSIMDSLKNFFKKSIPKIGQLQHLAKQGLVASVFNHQSEHVKDGIALYKAETLQQVCEITLNLVLQKVKEGLQKGNVQVSQVIDFEKLLSQLSQGKLAISAVQEILMYEDELTSQQEPMLLLVLTNGVRLTLRLRTKEYEQTHKLTYTQPENIFDVVKVESSPVEPALRAHFDIYREWKPLLVQQNNQRGDKMGYLSPFYPFQEDNSFQSIKYLSYASFSDELEIFGVKVRHQQQNQKNVQEKLLLVTLYRDVEPNEQTRQKTPIASVKQVEGDVFHSIKCEKVNGVLTIRVFTDSGIQTLRHTSLLDQLGQYLQLEKDESMDHQRLQNDINSFFNHESSTQRLMNDLLKIIIGDFKLAVSSRKSFFQLELLRTNLANKYYSKMRPHNAMDWTQEYLQQQILTQSAKEIVLLQRISEPLKKSALHYFKRIADAEAQFSNPYAAYETLSQSLTALLGTFLSKKPFASGKDKLQSYDIKLLQNCLSTFEHFVDQNFRSQSALLYLTHRAQQALAFIGCASQVYSQLSNKKENWLHGDVVKALGSLTLEKIIQEGEIDQNINLLAESMIKLAQQKEQTSQRKLLDIQSDSYQLIHDLKKRCCGAFFTVDLVDLMYARCCLDKAVNMPRGKEQYNLIAQGCKVFIRLSHESDVQTALYEMLRNACVEDALAFCKSRAHYFELKVKVLTQEIAQEKAQADLQGSGSMSISDEKTEALKIFEDEKLECFAALVSIVESIYKRKETILPAQKLQQDLTKTVAHTIAEKFSKNRPVKSQEQESPLVIEQSRFFGVQQLQELLIKRNYNLQEIQTLAIEAQTSVLQYDNKFLHFEIFDMLRRLNLGQEMIASLHSAAYIQEVIIEPLIQNCQNGPMEQHSLELAFKTLTDLKQFKQCYEFVMAIVNNKIALAVGLRLQWLGKAKTCLEYITGSQDQEQNLILLQKQLFFQQEVITQIGSEATNAIQNSILSIEELILVCEQNKLYSTKIKFLSLKNDPDYQPLVDETFGEMISVAYESRQESNWFADLLQKLNQLNSLFSYENNDIQTNTGAFQTQSNTLSEQKLVCVPLKVILRAVFLQESICLTQETFTRALCQRKEISFTEHQPGWIVDFILNQVAHLDQKSCLRYEISVKCETLANFIALFIEVIQENPNFRVQLLALEQTLPCLTFLSNSENKGRLNSSMNHEVFVTRVSPLQNQVHRLAVKLQEWFAHVEDEQVSILAKDFYRALQQIMY